MFSHLSWLHKPDQPSRGECLVVHVKWSDMSWQGCPVTWTVVIGQIIEDSKGGISVKGLTLAVAGSEEEAMNLFFEGETNRAIAEHQVPLPCSPPP